MYFCRSYGKLIETSNLLPQKEIDFSLKHRQLDKLEKFVEGSVKVVGVGSSSTVNELDFFTFYFPWVD